MWHIRQHIIYTEHMYRACRQGMLAGLASHPGCVLVLYERSSAVLNALECCRFVDCYEADTACVGRRCRRCGAADHDEQSQHGGAGNSKARSSHVAAPPTNVTPTCSEVGTYCNAQQMLVTAPSRKICLAVPERVLIAGRCVQSLTCCTLQHHCQLIA